MFYFSSAYSQTITVGSVVNSGTYGQKSSITVPLKVDGCFKLDNKFELYLIDASNNRRLIGNFESHFATFVNGVIPTNAAAGTYKLEVRSTNPALTVPVTEQITIAARPVTEMKIGASHLLKEDVFGFCTQSPSGNKLTLENQTLGNVRVTGTLTNDYQGGQQSLAFQTRYLEISPALAYYTAHFTTEYTDEGLISTRSYVVLNSTYNLNFGDNQQVDICTPDKLTFLTSLDVIKTNYPGVVYEFKWGDQKTEQISHCELVSQNGAMVHEYDESSCGLSIPLPGQVIFNAYLARVDFPRSQYCFNDVPASKFIRVSKQPISRFNGPDKGCAGAPITFQNISEEGSLYNSVGADCSAPSTYKWYVKGPSESQKTLVSLVQGKPREEANLVYTFPAPGIYEVELTAENASCEPHPRKTTICIVAKPEADFSFSKSDNCATVNIQTTNTSVIPVNSCSPQTYKWEVLHNDPTKLPYSPVFLDGTTSTQRDVKLRIPDAGNYLLRLTVSNGLPDDDECSKSVKEMPFTVYGPVSVSFPADDKSYCRDLPQIIDFSTDPIHRPTYTGVPLNKLVKWEIAGPGYSYEQSTSDVSDFPIVKFSQPGRYTIKVTYKSDCGDIQSATQTIEYLAPIVRNAGPDETICFFPRQAVNSYQMRGNTPGAGETGKWSLVSGPNMPGFANETNPQTEVTGLQPGVYTFRWTIKNALCEEFDEVVITVSDPPAKPLISNPVVYCLNDAPIPLTAIALPGNNLLWYTDAALTTGSVTAPTPSTAGAGQKEYYVVQVTPAGCQSDTAKIIVRVLPAIANNTLGAKAAVCYDGNPGTIQTASGLTLDGGTGIFTYQWQVWDANQNDWVDITGANGAEYAPGLMKVSKKFRRIVFSGNCSNPSNEITINVYDKVENKLNIPTQTICEGLTPANLDAAPATGGNGAFAYQWQRSSDATTFVDILGATTEDFQPGALTSTTYYRRLVSNDCANRFSSTDIAQVIVNKNALSEFTASKTIQCAPFNITGANIITNPHNDRNASFTWEVDGDILPSNSYQFPGYTINDPGKTVKIRLTTTSKAVGCNSSVQEMDFSTYNDINYASFDADKISGCGPLKVEFTNMSSPLTGVNFEWDFGNGQTSTAAHPGEITFPPSPDNNDITYTVKLRVFTDCDSKVFTREITVKAPPVAVFSPNLTSVCSSDAIKFTNQSRGSGNTYVYDFGDSSAPVSKSDNSEVIHQYFVSEKTTFTVRLTATNSCGTDTKTYDIVVFPNDVVAEMVVNGNQLTGCAPFTVRFDNNSTGATTFEWNFGDGNTRTTIGPPTSLTHTFNSPGKYIVTLKAINGCAVKHTTEEIEVYEAATAAFTTSKEVFCEKELIQFTNTSGLSSTLNASSSYLWDFGNGAISTQTHPAYAFTSGGTYRVKLTVTTSFDDGSSCSKIFEKNLEIIPLPVVNFTSNISALNCAPFELDVRSTSTGAFNVDWNFGDPTSSDNSEIGTNAKHVYNTPGTYWVTLNAYNSLGCAETKRVQFTVIASPIADFEGGDVTICETSKQITFKNTTTYVGSDAYNCKWYVNGVLYSTSKGNFTHFFSVNSNLTLPSRFIVTLEATSALGCTTRSSQFVQFNPIPVPVFSVAEVIGCPPFKPTITNSSINADSYEWYLDGTIVSTDAIPMITLTEPDKIYKLKLVAKNQYGCERTSSEQTLRTFPIPAPVFELEKKVSCNGRLILAFKSLDLGGATGHIWDFGDGSPLSTAVKPVKDYSVPGKYKLRLIATIGSCSRVFEEEVVVTRPLQPLGVASPTNGCKTLTVQFGSTSLNASRVVWDFGDGTYLESWNPVKTYTYHKSPYIVKMTAYGESGCDSTIVVDTIVVNPPPKAKFIVSPGNVIKIPNFTFAFEEKCEGAIKWSWDFGDHTPFSKDQNPTHTYKDIGTYEVKLRATNKNGCDSVYVDYVTVENVPGYLYVPNAFEPGNANTKVKYFKPEGGAIVKYEVKIFNRWGKLLWSSTKLDENGAPAEGWDGTENGVPVPQGVYIWDITAQFLDGTEWKGMKYENSAQRKSGPVHLIR
ncbi:PKD domain-containing protein [Pedobacter sp. SYSU D00535]|uniref:PKD domain-containing protein n=1 Tax=Pedobacter sp. SYSU D00535 TaxID=2810308 RepID=UPI001A96ECBF|nr:PKD domain-containing protein [Pedobacter sp. SYSU D00535]